MQSGCWSGLAADGSQGRNVQVIDGRLDINGVNLFTRIDDRLKAGAPIRLIEGGVVSPKNSGLGSPRKGKESSSESGAPRPSSGLSVGRGPEVG